MADSNRAQVSYVEETDWGTTPASAFQAFPITGGALPHGQESVRSQSLRDDAQLADAKRVGLAPTARYDFEFAANTYDVFVRNAIRSDDDWSSDIGIVDATDLTLASSGNLITSTTTWLTDIVKGQWIRLSGCSNAANNTWWRVTAVSAYSMTVAGGTLTDESGGTISISGSQITNGSTLRSVSLQEYYQDLTNRYRILTGARTNNFTLEQTEGGIITGSVAFDGQQRAQAAAAGGSGSVTDAPSKNVVTEVNGFENVWLDNTIVTVDIFALSLDIAVANRPRKALGNLARTAMPQGAPVVTGAMEMYLEDDTWTYDDAYEEFTAFSLAFSIDMQGGDYYLIEMPQCHFTDEPASNGGLDTDLMLSFSFDAEPGSSYGASSLEKTIQVCRVLA